MAPSLPPKLLGVLLLIGAGLGLYWLGSCHGQASAHATAVLQQAQAVLEARKPYQDSLRNAQDALQRARDSAVVYERRSAQRGATVARLDSALLHALTGRDSIPVLLQQTVVLRGMVSDLQGANQQLREAVSASQAAQRLAVDRADSLEHHLRATLQVAECRWDLVIAHPKCPSRLTSGVLGLASGLVAGVALSRH